MSKSIRNILVTIVPIALLGLGAQVHAQATDVDCFHCIDTRDITPKAVTSNKIASSSINTSKLKKGAVTKGKIASGAVTSEKIKDGAVTMDKLAPGAVTMDKLAPGVTNALVGGDVNYRGLFTQDRTEGPRRLLTDENVTIDTSECSRWLNFRADLRGGNFITVTVTGDNGSTFTCTDPVAVDQIAALLNGADPNVFDNTSVVCDGNTWIVGGCNPSVELSVNGPFCSCSSSDTVRPCIGNANWGGLNAAGNTCGAVGQTMNVLFQR